LRVFASHWYFSLLTLTCSSISEKLFEIAQKHFQHHKTDFSDLLREFVETFALYYQIYIYIDDSEINPALDQFYAKVGEFFNPDDPHSRELTRRALTDEYGKILSLAVSTRSDSMSKLIQNSFDVDELKEKVLRSFIWNMDRFKNRRAKTVKNFDVFCAKTMNFPTVFELVLRQSEFDVILRMAVECEVASGYDPKSSNEGDSSTSSDEEFEYVRGQDTESREKEKTRLLKRQLLNLSQLLCFINRHKILLEHLEGFLHNNLGRILSCALVRGNDLVDEVIETFKLLKNSVKFVEIIKRGLGRIKIYDDKDFHTDVVVFEYFCVKLDKLVSREIFGMDKVLKIIWESEKCSLLILAINYDWQNLLNIILEQISVDKFVKTLVNSFKQIFKLQEPSPESFEIFLGKIMSDHRFVLVPNDFVRKSSDESDEVFELKSKHFKIIFQILNVIAQADTPLTDLEKLFKVNFGIILYFSYRSHLWTEKVFEILEKNFYENKTNMIEWIRKGVRFSSFFWFNDDYFFKSITPECRSCINNFWIKLESFLSSHRNLMREFLISKFDRFHHPLILSLYFDIESLQSFYLKSLETRELLSLFANNLAEVFKNYDTKNYEIFFRDKFLIDESKKEELRTFKDENGSTMFKIIEANDFIWDEKTKIENAKEFYKLLQEIASEDGNKI
jgi:hypothetical protein